MSNAKALPARIDADGSKSWYVNGELHRDGGLPAVERANGSKSWYVNGKQVAEPAARASGLPQWFVDGEAQGLIDRRTLSLLIDAALGLRGRGAAD